MPAKIEVTETIVQKRVWSHDDTYEVVEVQVSKFKVGQRVRVTIEEIEK